MASTKAVTSTKEAAGKGGLVINQKLSLMVTLYREEGKRFDVKDAKLSLVAINSGKKQERTTAKMHFDLSNFAGVPSSSTAKVFKLSEKVSIRTNVDSRFLKSGTGGPGSAGASSAMSGMTAASGMSSDEDEGDDDFADIDLNDVPEPVVPRVSSSRANRQHSAGNVPTSASSSKVALVVETPREHSSSSASSEKWKPPSPAPPSAADSPNQGIAALGVRVKREKSNLSSSREELFAAQRAEDDAKNAKLTEQNEQLSANLQNVRQESQSMQEAHKQQIGDLKAKIDEHKADSAAESSARASADAALSEISKEKRELEDNANDSIKKIAELKKERAVLETKCKSLSAVEDRNRQLSRELDRLALTATATSRDVQDAGQGQSEVESRIASLREENERLLGKVGTHQAHTAEVRATYERLSQMYDDLRDHNVALQSELEREKEKADRKSISEADGREEVFAQLDDARQEVFDIEASKESLQSDHERLLCHVQSLQDRAENTAALFAESQREVEDLCAERDELKGQRDMAMQRALSRGKNGSGSEHSSSRSIGRVDDEVHISKDKYEREQARLTRRILELESEVIDLREDIEYEKTEKQKAREDRDKIRENARELERKTSYAAKQTDAMHLLRRKVSTHQMREQDQESVIADLQDQVSTLQDQVNSSLSGAKHQLSYTEDFSEVLGELVATKLSLAQAEEAKLNLQFYMKNLKKSEKAIQQRLAAHASRLEVSLGHANEELDRLRRRSQLADAREFNELGSDVDY